MGHGGVDGSRGDVDGARGVADGGRGDADGGRVAADGGREAVDGGRGAVDGGRGAADGGVGGYVVWVFLRGFSGGMGWELLGGQDNEGVGGYSMVQASVVVFVALWMF